MTWIIVIIVAAVLGGIVGYMNSGKSEDAVTGAVGAGLGCGYIILQIFLALVGLAFLLMLGNWLFG
jgi:hypothetical protein